MRVARTLWGRADALRSRGRSGIVRTPWDLADAPGSRGRSEIARTRWARAAALGSRGRSEVARTLWDRANALGSPGHADVARSAPLGVPFGEGARSVILRHAKGRSGGRLTIYDLGQLQRVIFRAQDRISRFPLVT